jgi:hypothetical protein
MNVQRVVNAVLTLQLGCCQECTPHVPQPLCWCPIVPLQSDPTPKLHLHTLPHTQRHGLTREPIAPCPGVGMNWNQCRQCSPDTLCCCPMQPIPTHRHPHKQEDADSVSTHQ